MGFGMSEWLAEPVTQELTCIKCHRLVVHRKEHLSKRLGVLGKWRRHIYAAATFTYSLKLVGEISAQTAYPKEQTILLKLILSRKR